MTSKAPPTKPVDADKPVEVYSVTSAETAELIRATMESEGIHCWINGEHQAGLSGVLPIVLTVRNRDVDQAFRVIRTFDH